MSEDYRGSMTLKDGRRVAMTAEQARALWQDVEASCKATAEKLPDEKAALNAMVEAFHRLKDFGWREAMYCPKDGSGFQVIEAGGTGVHHCTYDGEWPDGSWWIHADGDLWPSRPILFRLYPAALLNQEASRNRNSGAPIMSDLAGVEGFTPEDFAEAAEAIDDAILRNTYAAAASNRHNIILAALRGAAELSRLRTALEPFAALADKLVGHDDGDHVFAEDKLEVRHLRRAREVLEKRDG